MIYMTKREDIQRILQSYDLRGDRTLFALMKFDELTAKPQNLALQRRNSLYPLFFIIIFFFL